MALTFLPPKQDLVIIIIVAVMISAGISMVIDYSKIPGIKGANLEKYRKPPIESWMITHQA